ncbi:MAG: cyclopropane-fatty-acyl-phospholipid synthase family protein [Magnetospirillum sp.]|nr:cyclopropane-fatty-acyl-phospholipid synthase family protein [Magnetospirillum sp.]
MAMHLLDLLFGQLIHRGSLRIIDHSGRRRDFGDGSPPQVAVRFADAATERRVFLAPHYHLLEAYTDGTLEVEAGSFHEFLDICCINLAETGFSTARRLYHGLGALFLAWENYNPARLAQKRVSRHYDLREDLFRLFLDDDMQYSCAYFPDAAASLEDAQKAKKRHIAAKLLLADGQRILDIGSGWGGLALELARLAEVEVLGITLSAEQLAVARRRAAEAGLDHRVRFELMDYRKLTGRFDRVVSIGMFEHVGPPHYHTYFRCIRDLLTDDGVALVHSVGQMDKGGNNPWIRRRIFPGTYTPTLSQVLPHLERQGLLTTDVEILRLHYADTLREWRLRFLANRQRAAELYDERFCRMWEAYLSGCELGFRRLSLMVFQVQFAKDRYAVPLTRDYITDQERAWAAPRHRLEAEEVEA